MAGNPRIEDLRKRIEKDPGSRLFAQLAEELRKDGDLEEAIAVAREGLQKHPSYPSARMTLGRALLDTGDFGAARGEFEQVVKGAPDNILAGRYLAECLENLGEQAAAVARYKATLALAPGDKHILGRIEALEKGAGAGGPAAAPAGPGLRAPSPPPVPPAVAMAPPTPPPAPLEPIRLAEVEGEMELEPAHERPAPAPPTPLPGETAAKATSAAPIPLVAVDEEFELERPYENPTSAWGTPAPPQPPAVPQPTAPPAADVPPAPGPGTPLATPTLAELYFNQGSTQKAIEVYRELAAGEPGNQRIKARLEELEALQRALGADGPSSGRESAAPAMPMFSAPEPAFSPFASAAPPAFDIDMPDDEPAIPSPAPAQAPAPLTAPAPAPRFAAVSLATFGAPPPAAAPPAKPIARREAIERTITRLEQFLERVQRG